MEARRPLLAKSERRRPYGADLGEDEHGRDPAIPSSLRRVSDYCQPPRPDQADTCSQQRRERLGGQGYGHDHGRSNGSPGLGRHRERVSNPCPYAPETRPRREAVSPALNDPRSRFPSQLLPLRPISYHYPGFLS
jgi:hypothetical protein